MHLRTGPSTLFCCRSTELQINLLREFQPDPKPRIKEQLAAGSSLAFFPQARGCSKTFRPWEKGSNHECRIVLRLSLLSRYGLQQKSYCGGTWIPWNCIYTYLFGSVQGALTTSKQWLLPFKRATPAFFEMHGNILHSINIGRPQRRNVADNTSKHMDLHSHFRGAALHAPRTAKESNTATRMLRNTSQETNFKQNSEPKSTRLVKECIIRLSALHAHFILQWKSSIETRGVQIERESVHLQLQYPASRILLRPIPCWLSKILPHQALRTALLQPHTFDTAGRHAARIAHHNSVQHHAHADFKSCVQIKQLGRVLYHPCCLDMQITVGGCSVE